MLEIDDKNNNSFMIEKIKERPINKKKLIKKTLTTITMAVIFGLVACLTFIILEPVFTNWIRPEEEMTPIIFPAEEEEMKPEEMLQDHMVEENIQIGNEEEHLIEESQLQEILSNVTFTLDHYKQMYASLSEYTTELKKSMVIVTAVISDIDWFSNSYESRSQTSGVIIGNNGRELLILSDYTTVKRGEKITLTFYNNIQVEAQIKQFNSASNLAVLSVNTEIFSQEVLDSLVVAPLGSSNSSASVGTPVIALGSPIGTKDSMTYGMITSSNTIASVVDANYKLLITDMYGSQNATGVLFNLNGQIIGFLASSKSSSDTRNAIVAYGISDLKRIINLMSAGGKTPYLGISGIDVTEIAHIEENIPLGGYVRDITMDSPSMQAGLQRGDIIVRFNEKTIDSFSDYASALLVAEIGEEITLTIMRQVQDEYKELEFKLVVKEAN